MLKKTLCLLALCAAIGLLAYGWSEPKATTQLPTPPPATQPSTPGATPAKPKAQAPVASPMVPVTPPSFVDDDGEGGGYDPTQDPTFDPFSSGAATAQATTPGGDEEAGDPPPDTELVPENPVRKTYEDGKIIVLVGNERHFGYRIGDQVKLIVLVLSDDSVEFNFDGLYKGIISVDGSDFEPAGPPTVRIVERREGKTLRRIELSVQAFVPKKGIGATIDFLYAVDKLPDGKGPNWKRLTTPEFVVTTSNTADNGNNLLEGDLSESERRLSWFTYPLLLLGSMLVLLWPSVLFLKWYRRVHPPRVVPPNEAAWKVFDRAIKEGKKSGFTPKHYKLIASALRRYLGCEPATMDEVRELHASHPDLATIDSALSKCESVLYSGKSLEDKQNAELIAEIKKLVPRP